jgi:hypothetical protein
MLTHTRTPWKRLLPIREIPMRRGNPFARFSVSGGGRTHRGHQRLSILLIMMRETVAGCAKLLTQLALLDGKPQCITILIPGQPFFPDFSTFGLARILSSTKSL